MFAFFDDVALSPPSFKREAIFERIIFFRFFSLFSTCERRAGQEDSPALPTLDG